MEDPKPQQKSRKRSLDEFQQSPLYKMRVTLKDLRPSFIEVLKTPDFEDCSAAQKIREGMKVMMDLYKEIAAECVSLEKCSTAAQGDPSGNTRDEPKTVVPQEDVKCAENTPTAGGGSTTTSDNHIHGMYIVGGSAFGWNFITSSGSKASYYGMSKECYRAANPKTGE